MLAIPVAVARQPLTCLACETFCTLDLSSDNKTFYCFHYNFETLKCHYAKTSCSIFLKLTAFNNDTLIFLNTNFLRDQLSFSSTIKFHNTG